jgi:hypothetical protein
VAAEPFLLHFMCSQHVDQLVVSQKLSNSFVAKHVAAASHLVRGKVHLQELFVAMSVYACVQQNSKSYVRSVRMLIVTLVVTVALQHSQTLLSQQYYYQVDRHVQTKRLIK